MKFTFEADMRKGECFSCPCNYYDYYNDVGESRCCLDCEIVADSVTEAECPLEEVEEES